MSVAKNKEVTRLTIEEVMNKSNLALIPELFAPNYVHRAAGGQEIRGHDGWRQNVINGHTAFPDLHYTIDELIGKGEKVVCRITGTGTFKGEYMGVAPNGKRFTSSSMFINRFEEDKVVETWAVANPLISLQQLGITPPSVVQAQEANKAVLRRYFEEVLNKGNFSLLDELMDENYVMRGPGGQEAIKGRAGSKQYFAQMGTFASDMHVAIDEMLADGDKVVVSGFWEGTNTGEFQGNPPTGRHFKYGYAAVYSFGGGKITGGRIFSDTLGLYQQLGITPPGIAQVEEANRASLKRAYDEVWNKGNMSVMPELVSPNYHYAGQKGPQGYSDLVSRQRSVFPDLVCTIEDMVGEGDRLAVTILMEGTFKGKMEDIEPTGKRGSIREAVLYRFAAGKLVETVGGFYDRLSFFQQTGVTPPSIAQPLEANKAIVRKYFPDVSAQDERTHPAQGADDAVEPEKGIRTFLSQILAPNYVEHGPRFDASIEELIKLLPSVGVAFPDLTYQVDDTFGEGDKVVVRYSAHGTHLGEFQKLPPTGKKIEINGMYIGRVVGGKIAEGWFVSTSFSFNEILEQLRLSLSAKSEDSTK